MSGGCDTRQPSGARAATWGIWDQRPLVRDEYSPYRLISCTRRGGMVLCSSRSELPDEAAGGFVT